MQDQLRALITRHCTTLGVELEAVQVCLKCLDDPSPSVSDIVHEGIELTHKIKGSSGSIGFPLISAASADLERCLRSIDVHDNGLSSAQLNDIKTYISSLEDLINSITPEQSNLYNASIPA